MFFDLELVDEEGKTFLNISVSLMQLIPLVPINIGGKRCSMKDLEYLAACYKSNLHSLVHGLSINKFYK